MASYRENALTRKIRENNSVIRNKNHILKCTLKTMLDNPSRTSNRALCSLIGVCRRQCNGPVERVRPKRLLSVPPYELTDYVSVIPPPVTLKSLEKENHIEEQPSKPIKKPKPRNPVADSDLYSEPPSYHQSRSVLKDSKSKSGYACCSKAPSVHSKSVHNTPGLRSKPQNLQECSRRCCVAQAFSGMVPITMSPLCCPPPVKTLISKTKTSNQKTCTPIVRSYRCLSPRSDKKQKPLLDKKHMPPSTCAFESYQRPTSAPAKSCFSDRLDFICKGYNTSNRNDFEDSSANPPNSYPSNRSLHNRSHSRNTGRLGFKSNKTSSGRTGVNVQAFTRQAFEDGDRSSGQISKVIKTSEYSGRVRNDQPSITTWRTSKPIPFYNFATVNSRRSLNSENVLYS
ncbi:hypothetical protein PoB_001886400 [Plakobranchus ocellatus]|uniref:Uncharacterized protein n=1 Tax=Plakobranchus ocellatus TaxID=259542 RepID=A0AAV3ZD94_9GAST|nr:hypothetical protein PoB_001886400 [Plakobranchus ocellatus]